jgi:thiol-disulfide isomerase/thioredoxin
VNSLPKVLYLLKAVAVVGLGAIMVGLYLLPTSVPWHSPTDFDLQASTYRKSLPAFKWNTIAGKMVQSSSLEQQVVYLNFWSQTCEPCLEELPLLSRELKPSPTFQLIFVNVDPENLQEQARDFFGKTVQSGEGVFPSQEQMRQLFTIDRLPLHMLVDKQGKIAAVISGGLKAREIDHLKAMIAKLEAE